MLLLIFMLGACFGSFFYLIITRLEKGESIIFPASHCPYCHQQLKFWELLPIISICLLHFRCRYCHKKIPISSFVVEILAGSLFIYIFYGYQTDYPHKILALFWLSLAFLFSFSDFLYLTIDLRLFFIGHLCLWGLLFYLHQPFFPKNLIWCSLFLIISLISRQIYLGNGDLLLACAWFPWLSFQQINILLLIASGLGLMAFGIARLAKIHEKLQLPFIPFLSIGLLITYFWH